VAASQDPKTRLYETAEKQSGYFTASQALEAGYSYASQNYQRKAGNWLRDGWGIYRLSHYPHSADEQYVRLMLWSRDRSGEPQGVVSHDTALQVYDLSDVLPAQTHLTVPKRFRKKPPRGVMLHRADLTAGDVHERDSYRITSPLRTLLDAAASPLSLEHLETATMEALDRGLVRRRALAEAIQVAPGNVQERFAALAMT
jgi:predicted transcriptional regulator of viral defense system